jgi:hypothetical protein
MKEFLLGTGALLAFGFLLGIFLTVLLVFGLVQTFKNTFKR